MSVYFPLLLWKWDSFSLWISHWIKKFLSGNVFKHLKNVHFGYMISFFFNLSKTKVFLTSLNFPFSPQKKKVHTVAGVSNAAILGCLEAVFPWISLAIWSIRLSGCLIGLIKLFCTCINMLLSYYLHSSWNHLIIFFLGW